MQNLQIIQDMYAAFGRGDVPAILASLADDVSWEFEAPAQISWGGYRRGPKEVVGFFEGIASDHGDPKLTMTEFVESEDAVAAFGRYEATVKATGVRVSSPVGHLFKFRNGKVVRYINLINTAAFMPVAASMTSRA